MSNKRYIRQTLLDRIGEQGQQRLSGAHIAIVGCGGLGSIAGPYLAGAGVGKLTLIDGDKPDITNLHRQVFFAENSVNETKSEAIGKHITRLNSEIALEVVNEMISKSNISRILDGVDLVLECTDNIQAKYLVNDYCYLHNIPMVYGAIYKYDGYVSFFENKDKESIQLRDVFPVPNEDIPTCSEVGVIGTIAGMIGLMQANEAIKFFTKAGECMIGKLLSYDILTNNQMILKLKKSYDQDMADVYSSSIYSMSTSCEVQEIDYEIIKTHRSKYELISILEDHEHESLDEDVIRQPLSGFKLESWQPLSNKSHVFYCKSGIRSSALINKMNRLNVEVELFTLKDGIQHLVKK